MKSKPFTGVADFDAGIDLLPKASKGLTLVGCVPICPVAIGNPKASIFTPGAGDDVPSRIGCVGAKPPPGNGDEENPPIGANPPAATGTDANPPLGANTALEDAENPSEAFAGAAFGAVTLPVDFGKISSKAAKGLGLPLRSIFKDQLTLRDYSITNWIDPCSMIVRFTTNDRKFRG